MDGTSTDRDQFFAYEWVDDHVLVEPDVSNRLHLANETLRLVSIAIQLGLSYSRSPRYGNIAVDSAMIHDLQWTQMILDNGRLQELPLAMYTEMQPIDVHLYMDASNQGLAVLNPAVRQYIQVQFDEEEKDMIRKATGPNGFNINVREQMCVALAAWTFGPSWVSTTTTSMVFIKAWSDNKPTIKHQPNDTRSKSCNRSDRSDVWISYLLWPSAWSHKRDG
ncbi:hypothetical protein PC111_g4854 [Phytophthora cactorum]|nr:hypothetical protein PC111_g4854 [Phytophthora cactorum]KAG3085625.1 hypothetical protein PC122_g9580 [Phytophthora cactorum]KAG3165076.1 hypothetical protein C6341_g12500 [Phytophthora cactorum]